MGKIKKVSIVSDTYEHIYITSCYLGIIGKLPFLCLDMRTDSMYTFLHARKGVCLCVHLQG